MMVPCQFSTALLIGFAASYAPQSATFLPRIQQLKTGESGSATNLIGSYRTIARRSVMKLNSELSDEHLNQFTKADDGDALQILFSKHCDKDGLMTKQILTSVPVIKDLLVSSFY